MVADVRTETDAGVRTVSLDSPGNRNALSAPLVASLEAALVEARGDRKIRAVVLRGEGPMFCAGADLRDPPDPRRVVALYDLLWTYPKPVVACVTGGARAGGVGLVAAADIAFATIDSTFAFSEVRVGVAPAIIAVVCLRRMEPRALQRYAVTGEVFDATAATASGLLTAALDADELPCALETCLDGLRLGEPGAITVTKDLLRRLPELSVAAGFAEAADVSAALFQSDAAGEGMRAFRERRLPSWVEP